MPFHPAHHRVGRRHVVTVTLLAALLALFFAWSFRAGRDRALESPPAAIPSGGGALPAPVAPTTPAGPPAAPLTGPQAQPR